MQSGEGERGCPGGFIGTAAPRTACSPLHLVSAGRAASLTPNVPCAEHLPKKKNQEVTASSPHHSFTQGIVPVIEVTDKTLSEVHGAVSVF